MGTVNPWAGFYQGGAALRGSLAELAEYRRRRKAEERAAAQQDYENRRQARLDKVAEENAALQREISQLQLAEAKRKQAEEAQFKTGLAAHEATLEQPVTEANPGYIPPGVPTDMSGYGLGGIEVQPKGRVDSDPTAQESLVVPQRPTLPQTPAVSSPTVQRPLSENQKNTLRVAYALKSGRPDIAAKYAAVLDVTSQIEGQQGARFEQVGETLKKLTDAGYDPKTAISFAARSYRDSDPDLAQAIMQLTPTSTGEFMRVTREGTYVLDGKGGKVLLFTPRKTDAGALAVGATDPSNPQREQDAAALELLENKRADTTLTETELYLRAAGGDPEKARQMMVEDKIKVGQGKSSAIALPPEISARLGEIAASGVPLPTAPSFGWGASGQPARIKFWSDFVKSVDERGGAGNYGVAKADYKADTSSLGFQTKQADMMGSFVNNMGKQVDRLTEIAGDITRIDARLLNIPIRLLATKVAGSANEAKITMYLTEISNEIGKMSTGSTASVAELSEGAQRKWAQIHDPNLSISDLLSLLKETKHAGQMRLESVAAQKEQTKTRMRGESGTVPSSSNIDKAKTLVDELWGK